MADKTSHPWWDVDEMLREADDEFWKFTVSCIRVFKEEYPALYTEARKESYSQDEYVHLAITARTFLKAFIVAASTIEEVGGNARVALAFKAAQSRHEKDPRSQAMQSIRLHWEDMQNGAQTFKSDAAFAREMIQKYPVISNEGSIKNAVARWRKATPLS